MFEDAAYFASGPSERVAANCLNCVNYNEPIPTGPDCNEPAPTGPQCEMPPSECNYSPGARNIFSTNIEVFLL